MRQQHCPNDNHGRSVVTVRFCPNCGVVLNANILGARCPEHVHARARRSRNTFCVDCGDRLIKDDPRSR
jgi:hypothetical protein